VMDSGRADKILVFHFNARNSTKDLWPPAAVHGRRITEIAFDGQRFAAPDLPARKTEEGRSG